MNRSLIDWLKQDYPEVTCVMASKYLNAEDFQPFIAAGIRHFGENRVDDLLRKKAQIKDPIQWHFIGTLQSKKVKKVINHIDCLQTLDRESLAAAIEKYRTTPLPCMIQCNISNEPQKHGVTGATIDALLNVLKKCTKIKVIGVMGMAEETPDETIIAAQFKTLIAYQQHVQTVFKDAVALSMGMSQDYQIALKYHTTHLRLGRILLEEPDVTA